MDRHDLVTLDPQATLYGLDQGLPEIVVQTIHLWVQKGLPMTVCRQTDTSQGQVKLAISCVLQGRKYRTAVLTDQDCIVKIQRPVALKNIWTTFDLNDQQSLQRFEHHLAKLNCEVYVYGSYAYQYLTGQRYVTLHSDLDLVLYPQQLEHIPKILQCITALKEQVSFPIDGEIKCHPQWHVSFNELMLVLAQGQQTIIAKGLTHIALLELEQLWEQHDAARLCDFT